MTFYLGVDNTNYLECEEKKSKIAAINCRIIIQFFYVFS